jgi:hypothetical protein
MVGAAPGSSLESGAAIAHSSQQGESGHNGFGGQLQQQAAAFCGLSVGGGFVGDTSSAMAWNVDILQSP